MNAKREEYESPNNVAGVDDDLVLAEAGKKVFSFVVSEAEGAVFHGLFLRLGNFLLLGGEIFCRVFGVDPFIVCRVTN